MTATYAYIGREPGCGCVVACVVDKPGSEQDSDAGGGSVTDAETIAKLTAEIARLRRALGDDLTECAAPDCDAWFVADADESISDSGWRQTVGVYPPAEYCPRHVGDLSATRESAKLIDRQPHKVCAGDVDSIPARDTWKE